MNLDHFQNNRKDFRISAKRKTLKFRSELTFEQSPLLNVSIFDITELKTQPDLQSTNSTFGSSKKFVKLPMSSSFRTLTLPSDTKNSTSSFSKYSGYNTLTNSDLKFQSIHQSIPSLSEMKLLSSSNKLPSWHNNNSNCNNKLSENRKSLKKIMPFEKKLMDLFQQKFRKSKQINDALNFSNNSDLIIEQEFANTELEGEELFEKTSTITKRDAKKRVIVGLQSKFNFFMHHKQIDKISQENTLFNVKDSLFTSLIKSETQVNLLPKKLGIIKETGKDSMIELNYYNLGDRYAEAFSKGISNFEISEKIKKIELKNNGLSDKGILSILGGLSKITEELNLSQNVFGSQSVDKLVIILKSHEYELQKLNLENTKLGDSNVIKILDALKKLRILDLSNNRLTDECSTALSDALQRRCTLNELYLHWNRFTGETGKKVALAMKENTNLRVLDMSNNSLGLLDGTGTACSYAFSELFGNEESNLLHIDLSNNRWKRNQIEIISEGINANHSIYGFHIDNKFSTIDELGFMNLAETDFEQEQALRTNLLGSQIISNEGKANHLQQSIINDSITTPFSRINGLAPIQIKSDASFFSYLDISNKKNNCWICNGWREQLFVWKSGQSGMSYNGPIYVHMNFDNYKPIPMVADLPGHFVLRRMCPPSHKLLYFFSTPDCDTHAKDQQSVKNKTPFLKNIAFGSLKRDITIKYLNFRSVNRVEKSLFSSFFESIHITVLPREKLIYPKQEIREKVWTKETSLFSKYQQDTVQILEQAMDADWNNSKIPRFVKDPADRKKLFVISQIWEEEDQNKNIYDEYPLSELIKPHYEGIKGLYKFYSSFSPIGDVWAISKLLFTEIFTKSGLVDNKTLKLADLEIKFIASKTMGKKARRLLPERGMVRHEFFESIVRIAEEKYMINGNCTSYSEAVSHLFNDGFLKVIAQNESPAQWRDERYWVQECDFCYKYYMQILMSIYEQYENTIRDCLPKSKYLNLSEFKKIFYDSNILLDEKINERQINMAFNYSVQTQADEVYDERILQLYFIEFLEAIARCGEKFSLAPPQFPKSIEKIQLSQKNIEFVIEEKQTWTWEERVQQPLHKKIENLIKTIYLQALIPEERELFELSESSIFDFKDINEAMTAPMKSKAILKNIPFDGSGYKVPYLIKATDTLRKSLNAQKGLNLI